MSLSEILKSIIEKLNSILDSKSKIRNSIINKRVDVPEDAELDEMSDYIDQIILEGDDTRDATATKNDILFPHTAYVNGEKVTGEIPVYSNYKKTLNRNLRSVLLDAGYYKGAEISIVPEQKTVEINSSELIVEPSEGRVLSKVIVKNGSLEEVFVNPSEEPQIISPSDGKYGFSKVNVNPIYLQEKVVSPSYVPQIISADDSYYFALRTVVVNPVDLQNKIVSPSAITQIVRADSGYNGLGEVTVKPISMNYDPTTKILSITG